LHFRPTCTKCGAEAHASCDCGAPYVPAAIRVAKYDKANPGKSTRGAAADLGISKSEVGRARQSVVPSGTPEAPGKVTGRDGKTYKAARTTAPKALAPVEPAAAGGEVEDPHAEHRAKMAAIADESESGDEKFSRGLGLPAPGPAPDRPIDCWRRWSVTERMGLLDEDEFFADFLAAMSEAFEHRLRDRFSKTVKKTLNLSANHAEHRSRQ